MGNRRPLIGITPGYRYDEGKSYIKNGYYEGIDKAGGLAVLMPLTADIDLLDDMIDRFDGFLISGGPDLDAKLYGECNLEFNGEICPGRDTMELYIVRKAVEKRKPLFGICRGIQVMNAAMGGTLYQDIHAQAGADKALKHSQSAPVWYPTHEVVLSKGSKIWELFKRDSICVNSFHHQAVKDLAPEFKATSKSLDGIIESIEYSGKYFAVGVQWHPELMWQENAEHLKLFSAFVDSCRFVV